MTHILITGGCGYTGTVLTDSLISDGYKVTVVDTEWFGNYLNKNKNLNTIKLDIRNYDDIPLQGVDIIIHLAGIVNDPSVELNPKLSWEVNVLATQKLIENSSPRETLSKMDLEILNPLNPDALFSANLSIEEIIN